MTTNHYLAQQGTGWLCDLRMADISGDDALLRPVAMQAFYEMQHIRTRNHLSQLRAVSSSDEVLDATTFYWANPARYKLFSAVRNEDLRPRQYATDGIDSFALTMGTDDHFEHTQLGDVLHVAEGLVSDYDGCEVIENGFLWHPSLFNVSVPVDDDGMLTEDTSYKITAVYEHRVRNRVYRSAPAVPVVKALTGANSTKIRVSVDNLNLTYRSSFDNDFARHPKIVFYATTGNGTLFHRIGNALDGSNPNNGPVISDPRVQGPTAVTINFSDAIIEANEFLYTDGGVLENFPAPNGRVIEKHVNRLFVVPGEDRQVVYPSREYTEGDESAGAVAFNPVISFRVDDGGDIMGMKSMDEKLVIFKKRKIFVVYGEGPNDTGRLGEFTRPQLVSAGVGCIEPRSIVLGPDGVFFQSSKGMYMLSRGLGLGHIGAPAEDLFDGATVSSAVLEEDKHRVIWTLKDNAAGDFIVYDYEQGQWAKWESDFTDIISAIDRQGTYTVFLDNGDTYEQDATFTDILEKVKMAVTTGWLKASGVQGQGLVDFVQLLIARKSAVDVKVEVAYDYNETFAHDETFVDATLSGLNPTQVRVALKQKDFQAIKIRVSDPNAAQTGECYSITALRFEIADEEKTKDLPTAQIGPAE